MPSKSPIKPDRKRLILPVIGALAVAGTGCGMLVAGAKGGLGFSLGVFGTSVSLFGTWMAVQWIGKVLKDDSPRWQSSVVPVAALIIKLPVILGTMSWAQRLGPPAPSWFLGGLALVYSGLIWWGVSQE